LTIVSPETKKTVFDQTTVTGFFKTDIFVPPQDGTYRASFQRTGGGLDGNNYELQVTTDIPCQKDQDCPATLTCQVLAAPWGWSTNQGKKCLFTTNPGVP
jgi:hypothetical protein